MLPLTATIVPGSDDPPRLHGPPNHGDGVLQAGLTETFPQRPKPQQRGLASVGNYLKQRSRLFESGSEDTGPASIDICCGDMSPDGGGKPGEHCDCSCWNRWQTVARAEPRKFTGPAGCRTCRLGEHEPLRMLLGTRPGRAQDRLVSFCMVSFGRMFTCVEGEANKLGCFCRDPPAPTGRIPWRDAKV